ncbi:uncharacterized protein LOC127096464 [Lathyrus oleraceus]|uniref:uncharacterized protein LOC127096464 n=1 Tax=Pisum sativum TaxID=3888 RepID=UPI0021CEF168|nr:uncharacterized protein LOC127096464 [Pisum sativum]
MVTPTLFDAETIVGLHPNGIDFNPTVLNEDTIAFETSLAPYSLFMSYYHDKSTTEVSDVEHIAFLTRWLSKYVFCSRSLQVAKRFITIAIQLHAGTKLCLSEMILANLYESLSESVHLLKNAKTQAVRIPAKKTSVEASLSAAKKHSTKASRKPPTIQKRKSEEEKEKDKVPNEESGDESPELIHPPQKKKKLTKVSSQRSIAKSTRKDSASTPPAKPQSKDTESGKSSFNTEIPEGQVAVERTPEKILEETVLEEDIPISDHEMQTVAEFDATVGEASEDESPSPPGLDVAAQGDDTDMEVGVEDDHENEAAKDGGNQSKHAEAEQILERNTPPALDQTQGSGKSTGFFAEQFDHFWGNF